MSPNASILKRNFKARIVENRPVSKYHLLLTVKPITDTGEPKPGQFYMIGAGANFEPLLKRPLCFFRKEADGGIQFLYRVRGKGTALLKEMTSGTALDILGPLGNPYPVPAKGKAPVVIAGGTAIASVFPHIERLKGKASVIYGAKNKDELLMTEELKGISRELVLCTDDGSLGIKGTVIDVLRENPPDEGSVLYICGPREMSGAVIRYAKERGLGGYVSLEEFMACGVGACMGCVVKTMKGYKRVCKEGPVFRIEEISV